MIPPELNACIIDIAWRQPQIFYDGDIPHEALISYSGPS